MNTEAPSPPFTLSQVSATIAKNRTSAPQHNETQVSEEVTTP